jgi:hypothetical protein
MKQKSGILHRTLVAGVLLALIALVMVGTAAAVDYDMMDACRVASAGNGSAGYCPGLTGAGYAGQDNATFETCQRMMGGYGQGWNGYPGMMGGGGFYNGPGMMGGYGPAGGVGMMNSGFMWLGAILAFLFYIVWLAVGILAILWFMQQLRRDSPPS